MSTYRANTVYEETVRSIVSQIASICFKVVKTAEIILLDFAYIFEYISVQLNVG